MSHASQPVLDWRVVFNRDSPVAYGGWGRVRAAQFHELGPALRAASAGQLLNAIILVAILGPSAGWMPVLTWLGLVVASIVGAHVLLRRRMPQSLTTVSRQAIDWAGYCSIGFAGVWAIPALYFFAEADHAQQLAICLVTTGMMAGAAFIFGTIPSVACAYAVPLGAAVTNMLAASSSPFLSALGPVYTAGLVIMTYSTGRSFMRRVCLDIELAERADTISLLLRDYEDSDADWLWQTNARHAFETVSGRFARALGCSADELEGMQAASLLSDRVGGGRTLAEVMDLHQLFSNVTIAIGAEGSHRFIDVSARPRFSDNGRFLGYRGVGSDVTAARRAADHIAHMARHDALTGLPNRLHLMETLGAALGQVRAGEAARCAVLLVDLDRFKTVNDSLGHVAGDQLLRQVSARFGPLLMPGVTAGRLGGDEFALIIADAPDDAELRRRCGQLIEAIKMPFVYNDQHLFVGASIGVAIGLRDGTSVEELVRNADLALYRAKGNGGNEMCFYEPGLHAQAEERRQLELAMRNALDEGEFSLAFQPIMQGAAPEVASFEALMRWTHPTLGPIPPSKFIPIAEETGLIKRIGEWALRTACAEAAGWPDDIGVAVNISPLQLQETGFMPTLVSALSQSGLAPERLELEITETLFLNITPEIQKALNRIKSLGVRIAIDDFGTGYASLGYLRDTRFDALKIDRSFIQGLRRDDPESGAIIKAIVALAGNLGMATVAEGVETPEQLALVKEYGCNRVQGFIFSHPVTGGEIPALLRRHGRRAAA